VKKNGMPTGASPKSNWGNTRIGGRGKTSADEEHRGRSVEFPLCFQSGRRQGAGGGEQKTRKIKGGDNKGLHSASQQASEGKFRPIGVKKVSKIKMTRGGDGGDRPASIRPGRKKKTSRKESEIGERELPGRRELGIKRHGGGGNDWAKKRGDRKTLQRSLPFPASWGVEELKEKERCRNCACGLISKLKSTDS